MSSPHSLIREHIAERYDRIAELTRAGLSMTEIATRLGVTTRTVARARQARGCSKGRPEPLNNNEIQHARQLLEEGCSYNEVARTLRRSHTAIQQRLPGYGWTQSNASQFALFVRYTTERLPK